MPTYLVRIIETRDLVGVFSADNIVQLIDIVDECTEPDECEYTRMGPGGIMWASPAIPIPIAIPEDDDDGEPDPMPWAPALLKLGGTTFTDTLPIAGSAPFLTIRRSPNSQCCHSVRGRGRWCRLRRNGNEELSY
ncbi:hypothetical protein A4A58_19100 [Tardiphaga robiniae]|uniref:Uncharacterized protein n=1 Tax=Tardiphaga robiniae TaxID=943830 RepID=A0A163X381_9BRAD|nr:hypothetical protein A4A58_19100 [Tardiphaga robiniae]